MKTYDQGGVTVHLGDCRDMLATLPEASVQSVVTSPPYYGLRSYMPDSVTLRDDLSEEEIAYVMGELSRLGIRPTSDGV